MNNFIRHITGYFVGTFLFFILIPAGLIGLSSLDPIIDIPFPAYLALRIVLSLPFLIVGLFFVVWSNVFLFKDGKGGPTDGFNVAISPRTKKLVVTGPYRFSRNPMVFGAFSTYFGLGIFLLSPLILLTLTILIALAALYLKKTEEKRLAKDFGDAYIDYKKMVPMVFPSRRFL